MSYQASDGDDKATKDEGGEGSRWLSEIERAQEAPAMREWRRRCGVIRENYLYTKSHETKARRYSMLWSNIETLEPAVYSQTPKGVVQRRFRDADPIGREACQVLERGINFQVDLNDFNSGFEQVRHDYLLFARGLARVYYEPVMKEAADDTADEGAELDVSDMLGPDVEAMAGGPGLGFEENLGVPGDDEAEKPHSEGGPVQAPDVIDFEHVKMKYVHSDDFAHSTARIWSEVDWCAFRAYLSKDEWDKRFPKQANAFSADGAAAKTDNPTAQEAQEEKAAVWEIWDKSGDRVLWVSAGVDGVLDKSEPYLKLEGFFPCPEPAYGTRTNDSLAPVPDFIFYQDQCDEIDGLTKRIASLTDSLKLIGFYPGGPQGEGFPEIELAVKPGIENRMIAVKSWAAFVEGGKGGAPIVWLPIEEVMKIIQGCVELRKQLIEDVYQIFGISDIMRGEGEANETAKAQGIKAQFGSMRIRTRQKELSRFCRDMVRLVGEIIATQFQQETLAKMTNVSLPTRQEVEQQFQQAMVEYTNAMQQFQMQAQQAVQSPPMGAPAAPGAVAPGQPSQAPKPPQPPQQPQPGQPVTWDDVLELFKDGVTRRFRLDVEADSTISGDESQERSDRAAFVEAVTNFVKEWAPILQAQPALLPVAKQMLLFLVRGFRGGRELEETLEEAFDKLEEIAGQPKPNVPSPEVQAEQVKLQGIQAKTQAEAQKATLDLQASQADAQAKIAATQSQVQLKQAESAAQMQRDQQAHDLEQARAVTQLQHDRERHGMEMEKHRAESSRAAQAHAQAQHAATMQETRNATKAKADGAAADVKASKSKTGKYDGAAVLEAIHERLSAPRKVIRDQSGKITGVQ